MWSGEQTKAAVGNSLPGTWRSTLSEKPWLFYQWVKWLAATSIYRQFPNEQHLPTLLSCTDCVSCDQPHNTNNTPQINSRFIFKLIRCFSPDITDYCFYCKTSWLFHPYPLWEIIKAPQSWLKCNHSKISFTVVCLFVYHNQRRQKWTGIFCLQYKSNLYIICTYLLIQLTVRLSPLDTLHSTKNICSRQCMHYCSQDEVKSIVATVCQLWWGVNEWMPLLARRAIAHTSRNQYPSQLSVSQNHIYTSAQKPLISTSLKLLIGVWGYFHYTKIPLNMTVAFAMGHIDYKICNIPTLWGKPFLQQNRFKYWSTYECTYHWHSVVLFCQYRSI